MISSNIYIDVILGCAGVYLIKQIFSSKAKQPALPPGPKPKPLIGNLLDLPPPGAPEWLHWRKHKELYGPISSVTVFGQPIVIINDLQTSIEMLEKKSAIFSDRPTLFFCTVMCGWENSLPLSHYGSKFRTYRKFYHQFLGPSQQTVFHPLEEVETRRFLLRLLNGSKDLAEEIRRTAGAIILQISHGYTIEPQVEDPLVSLADDVLLEFGLSAQPGLWLVDVLPFLRLLPDWFPGTGFKRIAKKWSDNGWEFVERPFQFVKQQMGAGTARRSFVSSLLEKCENENDEFLVKWAAAGVYGGGADTTVSALYSFFLAMILYPEVQKKAQDEIDAVIGPDRLPTFADRERLPFINALVKETLRWHTVGPLGLPHAAIEDSTFNGYFIPKGTIIMSNNWQLLHDPENYHDPMKFKPERFLGVDGREAEYDPRNIAFGFGRRICPGRDLADASIFITIAMVLATLNIGKAKDEQGNDIEPEVGPSIGTISHPKDFKCSYTPRTPKAVTLIRSVEEEHPFEPSDSAILPTLKMTARPQ